MKGIQNDIKVALKGSENEVIQSPLQSLECNSILDWIVSERLIRKELRLKRSSFLIALMIVVEGGSNVWRLVKQINTGYSQFYRDIEDLKSKDLIVMTPEGRTKKFYPTRKLVEVVKKNYQEIQKMGKKRVKRSKPDKP